MNNIEPGNQRDEVKQDKRQASGFFSGMFFGILLTVCIVMMIQCVPVIYNSLVKHEINYQTKAKLIYNQLKEHYTGDIDEKDLYEGIYAGMVYNTTDKYSTYIPADTYTEYKEKTQGEYVGIGVVLGADENENIYIKYVYEGSPAEESGIKENDIIKSVEGVAASYSNYEDIVDIVRGVEGTTVEIEIYRPEQELTLKKTVERKQIDTPTVCYAMLEDKIGYIRISQFEGVTYNQFKAALDSLNADGMDRLIVDVRDNPGGLLDSVTAVLDEFLDDGVITYTEDKYGKKEYMYSKGEGIKIPVVVLTNASSASAAELFSAAVQDRGVGELVGETTYGKGVMQTTYPFSDGSALKLTTAKYYTPNGVCIDGVGVKPNYEIEANPDFQMPYISKTKAEFVDNDVQLDKAIEVIKTK